MNRNTRFRALLGNPPFICLGAHDAVTARLAEQAGAPAVYVSGFAASAIVAGAPDFGVLTQTEMSEHIRRVCRATTLPVFADADTGYGGPLDAARTMRLWEEAGASALQLEDQAMPKKCGHFAGKEVISPEEMEQKIRAMVDARRDPDLLIVARTDALAVTGLDDAAARLKAYALAGADALFPEAPASIEQMREFSRRLRPLGKPLLFNMAKSGKSPVLSLKDVYELGFDFAISPIEPLLVMHQAVKEAMETFLRNDCNTDAIADRMTPFKAFTDFIGLPDMLAQSEKYQAQEIAGNKS